MQDLRLSLLKGDILHEGVAWLALNWCGLIVPDDLVDAEPGELLLHNESLQIMLLRLVLQNLWERKR